MKNSEKKRWFYQLLCNVQLVIISLLILAIPMFLFNNFLVPFVTNLNYGVLGYAIYIIVLMDLLVFNVIVMDAMRGKGWDKYLPALELIKIPEKADKAIYMTLGMTAIVLVMIFVTHTSSNALLTQICNNATLANQIKNQQACGVLKNFT